MSYQLQFLAAISYDLSATFLPFCVIQSLFCDCVRPFREGSSLKQHSWTPRPQEPASFAGERGYFPINFQL